MTQRIALWAIAGVFGISAWVFSYAVQGFADIEVQQAQSYGALGGFDFKNLPPCVDWKFDMASSTATTTASTTRPRPPRPCINIRLGAASTTATTTATTTGKTMPKPPKPTLPPRPGSVQPGR